MAVSFIDPLAQTFFVDSFTYPKGMFVHSIDLIFKKKDTTTYQSVTLEIRPTINGYPHSSLIHSSAALGEVSLDSDQIKIVSGVGSDVPSLNNPNHYSRFKFAAPVFLMPGEHCFILYTPSDDYEVYVSEIGGTRLDGSERRVEKQPYAGSFFKSQNGSTYTAFQDIDLMFRVNACQFISNTVFSIVTNNIVPSQEIEYDLVKFSTQDLTFKDTTLNYFYKLTDNVTRTLDSSFKQLTIDETKILEKRQVVLDVEDSVSLVYKADLFTSDPKVSPMFDLSRYYAIGIKHIINDCGLDNKNFTIINPGSGYTSNATVNITGVKGSGATAVAVANVTTGQIESIVVTNPGLGYTENNTATITGGGGTNAAVVIASETNASGGPALSRYITRKVVLADGFNSNMIRVYFTAYQPRESNIEVYYKVLAEEDPDLFENRPYIRMLNVQQGNETLLNNKKSQVTTDFFEYLFIPPTGEISYTGSNSVVYNDFKTFAIKIVLRTSNPSYSPIIRDLRVLALAP
jgi:hypothetical protein